MKSEASVEETTNSALRRIKVLNFKTEQLDASSALSLVKQYLNLAAKWSIASSEQRRWPFFDIADCINPSFELPESVDSGFNTWKSQTTIRTHVRDICYWYVKFERLNAAANICSSHGLDHPYEPLIRLFEHGNYFTLKHGFIDVGGFAIPYFNSSPELWLQKAS